MFEHVAGFRNHRQSEVVDLVAVPENPWSG